MVQDLPAVRVQRTGPQWPSHWSRFTCCSENITLHQMSSYMLSNVFAGTFVRYSYYSSCSYVLPRCISYKRVK